MVDLIEMNKMVSFAAGARITSARQMMSIAGHMSAALALCTLLAGKVEVWAQRHGALPAGRKAV